MARAPKPTRHKEFEAMLAEIIGKQVCTVCGKPLGNGPRYQIAGKHSHPGCYTPIEQTWLDNDWTEIE